MRRFGLTVLTFAIVGPPIGLAVLFGLILLSDGALFHPEHADLFLLAAYVIGLLPASIAGAFVAGLEKPGFWPASRVGLIVGLILALFSLITQLPRLSNADAVDILNLLLWPVSICLVPTMVCWLVVRHWVWRSSASVADSDVD